MKTIDDQIAVLESILSMASTDSSLTSLIFIKGYVSGVIESLKLMKEANNAND